MATATTRTTDAEALDEIRSVLRPLNAHTSAWHEADADEQDEILHNTREAAVAAFRCVARLADSFPCTGPGYRAADELREPLSGVVAAADLLTRNAGANISLNQNDYRWAVVNLPGTLWAKYRVRQAVLDRWAAEEVAS